jgi:hypothetical protein
MTGLSNEQLTELVTRVHAARGSGFVSRGRPYALGLFRSVALCPFTGPVELGLRQLVDLEGLLVIGDGVSGSILGA